MMMMMMTMIMVIMIMIMMLLMMMMMMMINTSWYPTSRFVDDRVRGLYLWATVSSHLEQ